ncbi:MAG: hypothetical protein ACHQ4G_02415 [Opitutales bacterium]
MGTLRLLASIGLAVLLTVSLAADPLSKSLHLDFFRDTTSRHLHGVATRSDGRILNGPDVQVLPADLGGSLLWSLAPDGNNLLIGTGPDGKVLSLDPHAVGPLKSAVVLSLPESHIFALLRVPGGDLLAGTSPQGTLVLARAGKIVARAMLPVDSVLDFNFAPNLPGQAGLVLVATGGPGRIYQVDLAKFSAAGASDQRLNTPTALAAHGITLWASVRDDNLRRLVRLADGTVVAGSAPKGNVYSFPATGGNPTVLQQNRRAEVTDLLPWPDGFFAAVTFTSDSAEARLRQTKEGKDAKPAGDQPPEVDTASLLLNEPPVTKTFHGRSQLVWFPNGGFPEVVAARADTAFYRLQRQGDTVLITGGEEGELLGYDPVSRRSLTYAGGVSAQLNGIVPDPRDSGVFFVIGNNPAALEKIDFADAATRSIETQRVDLGTPAQIGAVHFDVPPSLTPENLEVDLRASYSSDELEGWGDWQRAQFDEDGWKVPGLRGQYVQVRLQPRVAHFVLMPASLYFLPQNRRPQLNDFHIVAPNFALIPAPDRPESPGTSLTQVVQAAAPDAAKARNNFLSSQLVPQTGTQVVFWNVSDPDGDNLVCRFSLRREGETDWTDLAVNTTDPYVQFEISHLPEGLYHTQLVVSETDPRPLKDRLSVTFETDDLVIDRTPPVILAVSAEHTDHELHIRLRARDALSMLAGMEVNLNNGFKGSVEQPDDGILDSRAESFTLSIPDSAASSANSIEVIVYDSAGNSTARRLVMPK